MSSSTATQSDLSPLGGSNVGKTANYVVDRLPVASHGTHVADHLPARRCSRGQMPRAAPARRSCPAAPALGRGCTQAALTEGMIDLVANRHVHVVNLSIGGSRMNDGSD
ncbi:hypothetical protein [Streptomyces yanii]|uniref:hypothetical protein n=1 Tax=Streptomyces yanii TaxID=78510 RepID=UPI0031EC43EF